VKSSAPVTATGLFFSFSAGILGHALALVCVNQHSSATKMEQRDTIPPKTSVKLWFS
jgi:hypothetical protein